MPLLQGLECGKVRKQLSWARLLSMAADAAKGMLYLHTRSPAIAHRDLKSANLLIDGQWHVKASEDHHLAAPLPPLHHSWRTPKQTSPTPVAVSHGLGLALRRPVFRSYVAALAPQ